MKIEMKYATVEDNPSKIQCIMIYISGKLAGYFEKKGEKIIWHGQDKMRDFVCAILGESFTSDDPNFLDALVKKNHPMLIVRPSKEDIESIMRDRICPVKDMLQMDFFEA